MEPTDQEQNNTKWSKYIGMGYWIDLLHDKDLDDNKTIWFKIKFTKESVSIGPFVIYKRKK